MILLSRFKLLAFVCLGALALTAAEPDDPFLWLEDVTGEKALDWVRAQNAVSTRELEAQPDFKKIQDRILSIMDSRERIPFVNKSGKYYYNFWQDEKNTRGVWRRTSLAEYKKVNPAWEIVLDVDKLAAEEKENWVYKGASILQPSYDRALVRLSRAGADATVTREFDLEKKQFVKGGFELPEAKSRVSWRNRDALYVATDFGPGSLTKSGYPRIIKEWRRGMSLDQAKTVFEGKVDDVSVSGSVRHDHGRVYEFIDRGVTFFTDETRIRRGDEWVLINKPADAGIRTFKEFFILTLRSDWTVNGKTFKGGSMLASKVDDYLKGDRNLTVLFEPTPRTSLQAASATKSYLIVNELDNVRSKVYLLRPKPGGAWERIPFDAPALGRVSVQGIDDEDSDDYFMTVMDYVTPSTLYIGTAGKDGRQKLKQLPAYFNADNLVVEQFMAKSKDGTMIPYFQVSRRDLKLDGRNPTLLYGYGGFQLSELPTYSGTVGAAWLERGGVYVDANIRGGGEFGPAWHNAARKENRQRAYDDFIAIAEDLIARKVTSPKHLGIRGGSNGGLLMGVMLTQRPDLFNAVVCQVPLLDMRRFNKLLAGASWMDEYGNPDIPEQWEYIRKYSPYQNLTPGKKYSPTLFTTSTRDDRVHPGHARKMFARMKDLGQDVRYYENIEGGHGGAANNRQAAYMQALGYAFLIKQLWPSDSSPGLQ